MTESWSFDAWFVAQHGKRPCGTPTELLRDRIASAQLILSRDESLLAVVEEWEARRASALYAWQIRDEQKKGAAK